METPLSWEQQEVFRLLKAQPGTMYQESDEIGRSIFRDWVRGVLEVTEITVTFVKATDRSANVIPPPSAPDEQLLLLLLLLRG